MKLQQKPRHVALKTLHSVVAVFGACFIVWGVVALTVLATAVVVHKTPLNLDLYGRIESGCLFCLLLFGLPLQFGLQRLGINQWWIYILLGAGFGALVGISLDYVIMNYDAENEGVDAPFEFDSFAAICLAGGTLLGAAHTWVAWLIRRPDRDTVPSPQGHKDSIIVS